MIRGGQGRSPQELRDSAAAIVVYFWVALVLLTAMSIARAWLTGGGR